MRFTRVVFGVSASPFLLNATISYHLENYHDDHPDLVNTLKQSIYVDDVTYGADDNDDAYNLYSTSTKLFADGGFNLRKFVTNSSHLCQRLAAEQKLPTEVELYGCIMEEDATYTSNLLIGSIPGGHKVLGVSWDPVRDVLLFDIRDIANSLHTLEPTKRTIVGFASRFYDPLGFLAPAIIMLKMFFQELCKVKLDWDEQLSREMLTKWKGLRSRFQGTAITLPRCYFQFIDKQSPSILYGFCDASAAVYAAVVYLCVSSQSAYFVTSKTRVAPHSQQTIPRLELLSCLLLAKLMCHVFEALNTVIDVKIGSCFTDSKVALFWIQGEGKQWKQFIHNRVTAIRQLVPVQHWAHCAGKNNPADLPSRGVSTKDLEKSLMWRHGPDWLPKFLPADCSDEGSMPENCISEMKVNNPSSHTLLIATENPGIGKLINCAHYSKLQKLLRVTALVRKFAARFKMVGDVALVDWVITASDLERAELDWITDSQNQLTSETNFELWKHQLDLFVDKHNIWRCGGRLKKANILYGQKYPILLLKHHPLTTLIVQHAHERTLHSSVKDTLTEVRSKYWLVKGRQFIRKIIYQCVVCRKLEGQHYRAAPPPPLPEFRVKGAPPFAYCGVDFAGPLYIRVEDRSESSKVWIALYTCCVTRAVHLELVPDMTTQTFLRSFKRFTARRGIPLQIISDNAKTFVSAALTLDKMLSDPEVQQYMAGLKVQWRFNLEKAPWQGGFFERMVQSMKRCLRKTIGKSQLSLDELTTVLVQVEAILNSRPISYVSSEDLEEPLTPSHSLSGRRLLCLPDGTDVNRVDEDFDITFQDLRDRAQNLTKALNQFWSRWREEYLLQLRERYSTTDEVGVLRSPIPGEVVVIHDEDRPRTQWRLGRVSEVLKSSDDQIRGVVLKVNTNGRLSTLRRPVTCLYLLEIAPQMCSEDQMPIKMAHQEHTDASVSQDRCKNLSE
ncbi:uncharacterized protein [Dysidea avara]|uniref:uncharacterized protein n=1 Tax=Dysidea avara TaxID=196820 RepID=UPI003316B744